MRQLAGTRGGYEFDPIGALSLKGLSDPVEACVVRWEPLTAVSSIAVLPLPAALGPSEQFAFVGRAEPLEQLTAAWKMVTGDDPHARLVLLAGEPGIGKTRLATQLARDRSITRVRSCCSAAARRSSAFPTSRSSRRCASRSTTSSRGAAAEPPRSLRRRVVRLLPELSSLVPDLPRPPTRSDPETERYRLFDAVVEWLLAVSKERPLLLLVDDLQWAGRPTLLLLRHIVTSVPPMRLLIVGTYRDTDLQPGDPLADMLADFRRVEWSSGLRCRG